MRKLQQAIDESHLDACQRGERSYLDPKTGYMVFTAVALRDNGRCCGCGCRHCPFGHEHVPAVTLAGLITDPWLARGEASRRGCDVLSYRSGGKDTYLALKRLQKESRRDIVLLTTYDGLSNHVAHQDIDLDRIREQSRNLGLPHLFVPVFADLDYSERIVIAIRHLRLMSPVSRLAFGDLHLEQVRQWRLEHIGKKLAHLGIELVFPVWQVPYQTLLDELEGHGVKCQISAVNDDILHTLMAVGDLFTSELVERLPDAVDAFGENGEFHTEMTIPANL